MELTEIQKKAVRNCNTNLLISAGAGTGKTRVLVERILHLLQTQKVSLSELLVLTFTEKAANEIKIRLSDELRKARLERCRRDLERAAIGTFHGFASRLLKEHPVEAGVDPDFRVMEAEQADLLKEEAFRRTVKKIYEEQKDAFDLLAVYGEEGVKNGILKVFHAARHEGKAFREFFEENENRRTLLCARREAALPEQAALLIRKLPEIDASGWGKFLNLRVWEWNTFLDFAAWSAAYKGKRKEGWKEWRQLLGELASLRREPLAAPWRERFERMALVFEDFYISMKEEKGFLDFDDLQMRAVGLFDGRTPPLQKLRERYQKKFKYILVDEFQDTNFLQVRFVELLSSGSNLFLVGDYKQSIYGFRGAEPRMFLQKERLYREGKEGERIALSESFRAEPALLDFTNHFFKNLWEEDNFPFEAMTPKTEQVYEGSPVEILVTEMKEDEDKESARMREARGLAAKIHELRETGGVPYGSMAILFQAMTLSGIYENALKTFGIPYFIVAGRGFYEQPEIRDVLSFLSHLETPFADIPLAATLRSPFFHITDDTLFWLAHDAKAKGDEAPLYGALKDFGRISEIPEEQKEQLRSFLAVSAELSESKDRVPLSVLVDTMLERTGYELSVLADASGGARRYANLKKLMALIREYEMRDRLTLASYLRTVKRLQLQEVRESEAQIALETGTEAVRLMTVHAAKGLEFPVVFIADLGHQGTHADSKAIIAHAAEGYGLRVRNEANREMEAPFFYNVIDEEIKKREDEEWKRLLYVAMTRAKSRLFLSGVHAPKKNPPETYRAMTSWMDWVMAIGESLSVKMTVPADAAIGKFSRRPAIEKETAREVLETVSQRASPGEGSLEIMKEKAPLSRAIDLPVSAFVLFRKSPQEFWRRYQIGWTVGQPMEEKKPSSKGEGTYSPADFGTVMHGLLERLDFKDPERFLERDFLERVFGGLGPAAVAEAGQLLRGFWKSPLWGRLGKAKQIRREMDFVLNGRHGLIQGTLDVLFEDENGDWHLLDYKTAAGDEAASQNSAYDLQIEIYGLAAHKILKRAPRSGIIYYLKNQNAVTVPLGESAPEGFFARLEKKIFDLQKEILDYSNERLRGAETCGLKEIERC